MAQPAQVKTALPAGDYVVVDNSAAPAFPTLSASTHIGYDTTVPGAIAQDTNAFLNGTVPDAALFSSVAPTIAQKVSGASTGSVASLALAAFTANTATGNSIIVVCGVGNGTAPTISDTQSNTYTQVAQVANGTAFNVAIFTAPCKTGANTVTVNNGGTAASIAATAYEGVGLLKVTTADVTSTNQGAATTTSPAVSVTPTQANDFTFVAFGLGTAAQTITLAGSYVNDSGQLNPTTPAGLFSFVSASVVLPTTAASAPSATVGVAEPWAVAAASLKATTPANTVRTGLLPINNPALAPGTRVFFKNPA